MFNTLLKMFMKVVRRWGICGFEIPGKMKIKWEFTIIIWLAIVFDKFDIEMSSQIKMNASDVGTATNVSSLAKGFLGLPCSLTLDMIFWIINGFLAALILAENSLACAVFLKTRHLRRSYTNIYLLPVWPFPTCVWERLLCRSTPCFARDVNIHWPSTVGWSERWRASRLGQIYSTYWLSLSTDTKPFSTLSVTPLVWRRGEWLSFWQ